MSLLQELLEEELGSGIRAQLLSAVIAVAAGVPPTIRRFDLNRFEVVIDGSCGRVEVFDVLEVGTGEKHSFACFQSAVTKALADRDPTDLE